VHLEPAPAENRFCGTLHDQLYLGDVTLYRVQTEGGAVVEALLPNSGPNAASTLSAGQRVEIAWPFDAGCFLHE
ncbi:MAG: TOBE domain-containing protein, partial [Lysobacterales bacterium]